jgi:hypothetical protein
MLEILLGVLIGIVIGYFIKKYFVICEIKSLKEQLQDIQTKNFTHTELSSSRGSSALTSLVNELNDLLRKQRALLETQQAHEDRLIDDIANISHDLRTPLTAIYGYLELLEQNDLTEEERRYYLNIAIERTEVLQNLIQNLFYLTRLQVDNITLKKEEVAIDQVLKEQVVGYYQKFEEENIDVEIDIPSVKKVHTNQDAAKRIINNLVINIIEHGVNKAKIKVFEDDEAVIMQLTNEITDDSNIQIDQIFKRHYMGSKNRNTSNSGLGLTISKELSEQLGHKIQIKIENNTFIVILKWV